MKTIQTILGPMDEALLERTTIFEDRPKEFVVCVEYRYGGELVHRSPWVNLKEPPDAMVAEAISKVTGG